MTTQEIAQGILSAIKNLTTIYREVYKKTPEANLKLIDTGKKRLNAISSN